MIDTISSRTPEGYPNKCHVCGKSVTVDPSTVPRYDAPCPNCGTLLVFDTPIGVVFSMLKNTVPDVFDIIDNMPGAGTRQRIYLDFAGVKMLDSAFLGKLIVMNRKIQAKKWILHLINIDDEIAEVFGITKLDKLFGL